MYHQKAVGGLKALLENTLMWQPGSWQRVRVSKVMEIPSTKSCLGCNNQFLDKEFCFKILPKKKCGKCKEWKALFFQRMFPNKYRKLYGCRKLWFCNSQYHNCSRPKSPTSAKIIKWQVVEEFDFHKIFSIIPQILMNQKWQNKITFPSSGAI